MGYTHTSLDVLLKKARVRHFSRGQVLLYQGDTSDYVYILKNGYVKVFDVDSAGNQKILSIVIAGDLIPYSFFSGKDIACKWFYEALSDSDAYVIEKDVLLNAVRSDGALYLSLVENFSNEVYDLLRRISSMGKSNVESKLLTLFQCLITHLNNGNKTSTWFRVPFSVNHQFVADMTGVTRESCAVYMKKLSDQGVVKYKGHKLEINTTKLQQYEH